MLSLVVYTYIDYEIYKLVREMRERKKYLGSRHASRAPVAAAITNAGAAGAVARRCRGGHSGRRRWW